MRQVEVVLGRLVPRKRGDPLEVTAHDSVLGHRRLQALEPAELSVDLLAHLLGQLDGSELLAQLGDLRLDLVGFAELLLDRLQLLAEEVLTLTLLELGLHLRLDLGSDRDHLELPGQDLRESAQPLGDVELLQQRLLLVGLQPQRAGDQVGQAARILDVGDHDLQLFGQVRDLGHDVGEGLLDVAHQRDQFRRLA